MRKKILFIIPLIGSYKSFLKELGAELVKQGYNVFLLTSNTASEKISGINIINSDFPRGMNLCKHLRCAKEIRKVVHNISPDIINVHFSANIFTVALAKEKSWPPVLATFHGLSFPVMKSGILKQLVKAAEIFSSIKMDYVSVLTEDDVVALRKFVKKSKLYCYKSKGVGCDVNRFCKCRISEKRKEELKKSLGISRYDKVMIFVGRFVAFKGFDLVARVFTELNEPELKLMLLGGKDPIHATGLSVEEEKFFFKNPNVLNVGYVDNVEDYLAISDIMLFPSTKEGLPVCVMEALAMEVPVIVPDSRGCNSLIKTGKNGIILENMQVETIVECVKRLIFELECHQMVDYMKRHRNLYDRNNFIQEQLAIYNRLIK